MLKETEEKIDQLLQQDKKDDAIKILDMVLKKDIYDKEALYKKGLIELMKNNFENVIKIYEFLKTINIDIQLSIDIHLNLVISYFNVKQYQKTIETINKIEDISSEFGRRILNENQSYIKLKKIKGEVYRRISEESRMGALKLQYKWYEYFSNLEAFEEGASLDIEVVGSIINYLLKVEKKSQKEINEFIVYYNKIKDIIYNKGIDYYSKNYLGDVYSSDDKERIELIIVNTENLLKSYKE